MIEIILFTVVAFVLGYGVGSWVEEGKFARMYCELEDEMYAEIDFLKSKLSKLSAKKVAPKKK